MYISVSHDTSHLQTHFFLPVTIAVQNTHKHCVSVDTSYSNSNKFYENFFFCCALNYFFTANVNMTQMIKILRDFIITPNLQLAVNLLKKIYCCRTKILLLLIRVFDTLEFDTMRFQLYFKHKQQCSNKVVTCT